MTDVDRSERTIFVEALDLPEGGQREAYLDEVCGADPQLRHRVESLLDAHQSSQEPLARFGFNEADEGPAITLPSKGPFESIGDWIGPYKLLEQIGEGGFGVVFLAEQQRPVRRRVALKIVKPGMDTRQVIRRFEAERQALAMMDHPNIAMVLDAGTTESGRPYFVMDLVRGIPITDYCDQCNLTTRERLRLVAQVCQAVQHAHQKGIIHRDLKPSNVMIAMQSGAPTPKIIDFGVAKAINQRLTEHTLVTAFSQMVGTPLYMSPEQAELSPLDIDTRSDIYSLGVLLYELLTGTTPFDKDRLHAASYDELRRIIREEEPPRPSARLSTLAADRRTTVAEHRRTDARRLLQTVRGDLDWIVMKCVDKDRNRRYETADGLARDIERYLNDDAVHACPPSAGYRLRKFARRNRVALVAASAIVAMLLLLIVGLAVSNRLIAAERNEKARALAEKEQALTRAEAERHRAEEDFRRARIAVRGILSDAARGVGEWSQLPPSLRKKFAQETVNFYQSLLQEESADPSLRYETAVGYRSLSVMYNSLGERQQAEKFLRRSIAILDELTRIFPMAIRYRHQLAFNQYTLGLRLNVAKKFAEAETALQTSVNLYKVLISDRPGEGDYYLELAVAYQHLIRLQDRRGEAEDAWRSARQLSDLLLKAASASPRISDLEMFWRLELLPKVPPASPIAPDVSIGIAQALINSGWLDDAIAAYQEVVRAEPDDAVAHYNLACVLETGGQFEAAIDHLQKAIELQPNYSDAHNGLAWLLSNCPDPRSRDPERAVGLASRAVELAPTRGGCWNTLGVAQYRAGEFDLAKRALNKSLELQGEDSFVLFFLAMAEWQIGKEDGARESYRKAVEWMENQRADDAVLIRFRSEAAELIGVPDT